MPERSGPMACPIDGSALTMSERQGIEIDYCPQCRGVWLDRGELDKIIERSAAESPSGQRQYEQPYPPGGYDDSRGHHGSGHGHRYGRRKRSFLHDLFD